MRAFVVAVTSASLLVAALLHARAVSALVAPVLAPPLEALAAGPAVTVASSVPRRVRSASALLARNPFDHEAAARTAEETSPEIPEAIPDCPYVNALFTVRGEDDEGSIAAIEVAGRKLVRAPGGDVGERQLLAVGPDRVLLGRSATEDVCVARVFAARRAPEAPAPAKPTADVDPRIAKGVVRVSDTEVHVDRAALEPLAEALSSGRVRAVPERDGDRLLGLRLGRVEPGSVVARLGLASGDRVEAVGGIELSDTSALLAAWARLRAVGEGRIPVRLTRAGKTMQLDVTVR